MFNFGRVFLLLGALFCASLPAFAGEGAISKCESKKFKGRKVSWCHFWEPGSNSKRVLYYFHGLGGSEKSWEFTSVNQALRLESLKLGVPMPHVFAISFGQAWLLTDVKKARDSSRLDTFLSQVLPATEAILRNKPESRVLVGESMGGYNALRADMAEPEQFDKVAALCPALSVVGPYASASEEKAFIARTPHLDVPLVQSLKGWVKEEFPSEQEWAENSVLEAMKGSDPKPFSASFISANSQDGYGFLEGSVAFAKKVQKKFGNSVFRLQEGTHCQHSPEMLADLAAFLLKP